MTPDTANPNHPINRVSCEHAEKCLLELYAIVENLEDKLAALSESTQSVTAETTNTETETNE